MLSIGDLARHTRVSARMLRHYDALGLVTPERVDESTGYRWYAASQIGRVNSVVALKELGFTLEQCRSILDERVGIDDLMDLLRLRQAELAQRIEADTARLAEVGRRLRSIERGLTVTNESFQLKELPPLRLVQAGAEVNDISEIGTMTAVLLDRVSQRLSATGVPAAGPRVQTYYGRPDGSKIDVAVGWPVAADWSARRGWTWWSCRRRARERVWSTMVRPPTSLTPGRRST
ncbi:helix-turn-helix domain-containing protein [Actinoplanes sp. NPDC049548]|uniref:MerR family transcriptional regulator n=1 Tax=Actinoplanes sp. NPDC049548 TaxID=3155152 RepID=UPI00342066B9